MLSQLIIRSVQAFSDDTAAPPYEKKLSEFAAIIQQIFFAKISYIERNYAIIILNSYPRVAQNLDIQLGKSKCNTYPFSYFTLLLYKNKPLNV